MPIVTLKDLEKRRKPAKEKKQPGVADDDYVPSSEEEEEEEEEERLGDPKIEEEEIPSDTEEYEENDLFLKKKRSVVIGEEEIKRRTLADPQFAKQGRHREKRFTALRNRLVIDGKDDKDKRDEELEGVVDWSREDAKARYSLMPDDNGDYMEVGDGVFKQQGKGNKVKYRRADTETAKDGSFQVERICKSEEAP